MKIFLSYSRTDREAVDRLAGRLEAAGHSVWIDRKGVTAGRQWRRQIVEAIESADAFLVALSPKATGSKNVRKELDLAEGVEARIIPVIIEAVTIPPEMRYQLVGLQRVNLAEDYEAEFERLLFALGPPEEPAVPERPHRSDLSQPEETARDLESPQVAQVRAPATTAPASNTMIWEKDGKEMVRVPAGTFLYGDEKEEKYLPEYWIDKAPVTNAEYARFVAASGHKAPEHWEGKKRPPGEISDHPVVNVSWEDAAAYAEWAGKQLPTEEEWEKAARGKDGRKYPWGDQAPTEELCNFGGNVGTTTPVGRYSPQGDSPYGCVDMSGNVWEWTDSWYDEDQDVRTLRGGSWNYNRDSARAASRNYNLPPNHYAYYGFRVVRRPPSQ